VPFVDNDRICNLTKIIFQILATFFAILKINTFSLTLFSNSLTMTTTDHIRNGIIEKLLTISNKDYLTALFQLVKNSPVDLETVKLTEEQIVMLKLSERDIKDKNLIPQSQLDKSDLKWLKEL
jgi:hypothetical protein